MSSADRPISHDHQNAGGVPPVDTIRFFPPFPSWTGFDVIGIAVIFLIAMVVCWGVATIVASMLPGLQHSLTRDIAKMPLVGIVAQTAAYVIVFFYMMRVLRQRSGEPAFVAIQWNSRLGTVVMGVFGGLILATLVQLAQLVLREEETRGIDLNELRAFNAAAEQRRTVATEGTA